MKEERNWRKTVIYCSHKFYDFAIVFYGNSIQWVHTPVQTFYNEVTWTAIHSWGLRQCWWIYSYIHQHSDLGATICHDLMSPYMSSKRARYPGAFFIVMKRWSSCYFLGGFTQEFFHLRPLNKASVFVRIWRALLRLEYEYIKRICMKHNHWNVSKSIHPTSIFFLLSYFITCIDEENWVQSTRVQKEYGDWLSQGPAINTLSLSRTVP